MESRFTAPAAQPPQPVAVARVYIDNDLPHLDKLFDYAIPTDLDVKPGIQVRVRFSGKLTSAWVYEVTENSEYTGKLLPIERIVSPTVVATPAVFRLAADLAGRHCVPVAKLLTAMIPPRHAGAEKAALASVDTEKTAEGPLETAENHLQTVGNPLQTVNNPLQTVDNRGLNSYYQGASIANALSQQLPVRALWQLVPTDFPTRDYYDQSALVTAVYNWAVTLENAASKAGKATILVIVPTQKEITQFHQGLRKLIPTGSGEVLSIATISSADTPAQRYETFLKAARGHYRILIGTRSAAYQPIPHLAGIVIFDDGDTRHQDPQSPYLSSLDISLRRAHLERCALIIAGAAPSIQAIALAESRWAQWVLPTPAAVRKPTAPVQVIDQLERDRQGSAGKGRLPAFIQTKIRKALTRGPVLVSVPRRGWISIIRCENCAQTARCVRCQGPIRVSAGGNLACAWCADPQYNWHCHNCQTKRWRPARLGSERTFEELGRAFTGTKIIQADAHHPVTDLPAGTPCLVVATPGAEPSVPGGYQQIVVLDADAVASRPELWAPEEAMRRWMRLLGATRQDGELTILGIHDPAFAQALIRKDPVGWARQTMFARAEVGFYPSKPMVAIDGSANAVAEFTQELSAALEKTGDAVEILGTAPRLGKDVPKAFHPQPTRLLLRATWETLLPLLSQLRQIVVNRSLKKQGLVTIRVNPRDLL